MRNTSLLFVVWSLLPFAVATAGPADDPSGWFALFVAEPLAALAVDCPAELGIAGDTVQASCYRLDAPFKKFRKQLEQALAGYEPRERIALLGEGWKREEAYRTRPLLVERQLLQLGFDEAAQRLVVLPPLSCLGDAASDPALPRLGRPGWVPPKAISRSPIDYPEGPRVERAEGLVLAQLLVSAGGAVEQACVQFAQPAGRGFEEAALASLRGWRFQPATVDGEAVRAASCETLTWVIHGQSQRSIPIR